MFGCWGDNIYAVDRYASMIMYDSWTRAMDFWEVREGRDAGDVGIKFVWRNNWAKWLEGCRSYQNIKYQNLGPVCEN